MAAPLEGSLPSPTPLYFPTSSFVGGEAGQLGNSSSVCVPELNTPWGTYVYEASPLLPCYFQISAVHGGATTPLPRVGSLSWTRDIIALTWYNGFIMFLGRLFDVSILTICLWNYFLIFFFFLCNLKSLKISSDICQDETKRCVCDRVQGRIEITCDTFWNFLKSLHDSKLNLLRCEKLVIGLG